MQKLLVLTIGLLVASSCTINPCLTKGQFINGYNSFTDQVSEKYEDLSEKQWESRDKQMESFVNYCYKKHEEKLEADEKKSFWVKYFKYKFQRHGKDLFKAIESDAKEYSIEIENELENLFDNPEEDVKLILREMYGDDLNEAVDEFVKGIEDLADMFKKWLEE